MPKPKITWEGFGRLGPPREAYEIMNLGLSKVATRIFVRCHVRNNYADEYEDGFITCMYFHGNEIRDTTLSLTAFAVWPPFNSMWLVNCKETAIFIATHVENIIFWKLTARLTVTLFFFAVIPLSRHFRICE